MTQHNYRKPRRDADANAKSAASAAQDDATGERPPKPDTGGGIKTKMRGDEEANGLVTRDQLVQCLIDEAHRIRDQFDTAAFFKWSTFYSTPCDADGNKVEFEGPKHRTMTPYRPASDQLNL